MWYAPKGGDIEEERSRSAVWLVVSSGPAPMDAEGIFKPEDHDYEIVRIQKKEKNGL